MKDWKKWDEEAILELTEYHSMGLPYKEIAEIMERSESAIKAQCSKMARGDLVSFRHPSRNPEKREYVDTPLLDLVRKYKTMKQYQANLFKDNLPPTYRIVKEYGSWTKAKLAAGQDAAKGVVLDTDSSVVYLIKFAEGFYKIGITSRRLKERFAGYPEYKILDIVPLPSCEAKKLEQFLLKKYKAGTVQTDNLALIAGGITECFYCDEEPHLR